MQYRGMFAYPWDFGDDPDRFLDRFEAYGCNMLTINGVYHQINTIGMRINHAYERSFAGTSFAVAPERYGRIVPRAVVELDSTYQALRERCSARGIDWRCWIVNLHNDDIGVRYPDTAVRNLWGDSYPSSLCVNHPDVQEYAVNLLEDVIRAVAPSRVIMETESFMSAFHGRHHEFTLARMTSSVRYLLSLCFCPHCMNKAMESGVDALAARRTAQILLERMLKEETWLEGNEDAQLLQIFLEYPELYHYQQFRNASVTDLVRRTSEAAHARNVRYEIIPSAFPFGVNHMHYEGSALKTLGELVDAFVPLCYAPEESYSQIVRAIRLFSDAPVALALNLGRTRYRSWSEFMSKLEDGLNSGAESVYCYNYGIATDEALNCMGEVYRKYGAKEGT